MPISVAVTETPGSTEEEPSTTVPRIEPVSWAATDDGSRSVRDQTAKRSRVMFPPFSCYSARVARREKPRLAIARATTQGYPDVTSERLYRADAISMGLGPQGASRSSSASIAVRSPPSCHERHETTKDTKDTKENRPRRARRTRRTRRHTKKITTETQRHRAANAAACGALLVRPRALPASVPCGWTRGRDRSVTRRTISSLLISCSPVKSSLDTPCPSS